MSERYQCQECLGNFSPYRLPPTCEHCLRRKYRKLTDDTILHKEALVEMEKGYRNLESYKEAVEVARIPESQVNLTFLSDYWLVRNLTFGQLKRLSDTKVRRMWDNSPLYIQ